MKAKSIFIISLMMLIMGMHNASAQILSASLDEETVTVGKNIVFSVNMDSENISGIQFDIVYDDSILECVDTETSEFYENALASGINTDNSGSISVLMGFSEEQKINGNVLNVIFRVNNNQGDKTIKVNNIKLSAGGNKITEEEVSLEFKTRGKPQSAVGGGTLMESAGTAQTATDEENSKQEEESNTDNNTSEDINDTSENNEENSETEEKEENILNDISGHWAEESIIFMIREGIVTGFEDKTFKPDKEVTRAEFAVMISKALALEDMSENIYADVSEDAWYKDEVLKCTGAGIIEGDNGNFRPEDLITREEMTVIIYRAEKYFDLIDEESTTDITPFDDDEDISYWAKKAVIQAVGDGIIQGMDNNIFAPKLSATRAQAVVVLEKLLKLQWS